MLKNLKVGGRLVVGFATILVLLGAVGAISISQLAGFKAELVAVTGDDAERLRLAASLRDLSRYKAITLRDAVLQNDFSFKMQEIELMKAADEAYIRDETALRAMSHSPAVVEALENVALALVATSAPAEEALDYSLSYDFDAASESIRQAVRPVQQAHVEALDRLVEAIQAYSRERAEGSKRTYQNAVAVIIALSILAVLLGILIAWLIWRSITRPLMHAVDVAQAVAEGNLTKPIVVSSRDEVAQLLVALKTVNLKLGSAIDEVCISAEAIQSAASEIATANADLNTRTELQAANIQEAASAMGELSSTVSSNAQAARNAVALATSASEAATNGGQTVSEVVEIMSAISESSDSIAAITSTIDALAFQTNILALNAAVEAARAGEQGRGFAVVASEVRNLAQRSAEAAREIKALIDSSVKTVQQGARLTGQAGSSMTEIVSEVSTVRDLIREISHSSDEQTTGIEQMSTVVHQLEDVTQQNSTMVEEGAAEAERLRLQALELVRAISVFKTESGAGDRAVAEPT